MEYLYEKQFYIDRYDLLTIRECRDMVDVCKQANIKGKSDPIVKGPNGKGELAKATQQKYLGVKAWDVVWHEEYEKKRKIPNKK